MFALARCCTNVSAVDIRTTQLTFLARELFADLQVDETLVCAFTSHSCKATTLPRMTKAGGWMVDRRLWEGT